MGLFGGGNSSSNSTTNNYDQRQVNTWDFNSYDLSNRSRNDNHSYTSINTLDGGAVAGALGFATNAVQGVTNQLGSVVGLAARVVDGQNAGLKSGYQFADHLFNHATDVVAAGETAAHDAFTRAAQMQTSALGLVQNAYADAKGTTQAQSHIILAVLAVAALAMLSRRG
jgi:hypothetical protein